MDRWRGLRTRSRVSGVALLGVDGASGAPSPSRWRPRSGRTIWSYVASFRNPAISLATTEWEPATQSPPAIAYLADRDRSRRRGCGGARRAPRRLMPVLVVAGFVAVRGVLDAQPDLRGPRRGVPDRLLGARSRSGPPRMPSPWSAVAAARRLRALIVYVALLGPARPTRPGYAAVRYALKHPPSTGGSPRTPARAHTCCGGRPDAGGDRRLARALQAAASCAATTASCAGGTRNPTRAGEPAPRGRRDRPPARRDRGARGPWLQSRVCRWGQRLSGARALGREAAFHQIPVLTAPSGAIALDVRLRVRIGWVAMATLEASWTVEIDAPRERCYEVAADVADILPSGRGRSRRSRCSSATPRGGRWWSRRSRTRWSRRSAPGFASPTTRRAG